MNEAVAPRRIVSLVPSHTETLIDYGLLDRLVGRTRYCEEPAGTVERIEALGGTKDPDIARIVALAPDLVIVNKEENRREDFDALHAAGLEVYATHPRSVVEAVAMLRELGEVCGAAARGRELAERCEAALEALPATGARASVFCPIWRKPWMTFHEHTYVGDVLRTVGLANVFAEPRGRDFFEVELPEVIRRGPELALLPDEPFPFTERHAAELREAGLRARCVLIDGKDLSWYGPRIPAALARLAGNL